MNCGLSNLATLKAMVLPATVVAQTGYDTKLATIGTFVAGLFDQFCNRKFAWAENAEDVFTGDRPQWYVQRYPIATNPGTPNQSPQITSVNMRYFLTDDWTNIVGEPLQVDAWKGKIHFGYTLGRAPLQVQVIYNGGYWFQTADTTDVGYTGPVAQPTGSVALPADLQGAFFLQVAEVFRKMDPLGQGIAARLTDAQPNTGTTMRLVPLVEMLLRQYIRYQLS